MPWDELIIAFTHACPHTRALRARSKCLVQDLGLYWSSSEFGDLWYMGISPTRNSASPGPYIRNMLRALYGGGLFLTSEVPLYTPRLLTCEEVLSVAKPPRCIQLLLAFVFQRCGIHSPQSCWIELPYEGRVRAAKLTMTLH